MTNDKIEESDFGILNIEFRRVLETLLPVQFFRFESSSRSVIRYEEKRPEPIRNSKFELLLIPGELQASQTVGKFTASLRA
jgi:hypothetical protein